MFALANAGVYFVERSLAVVNSLTQFLQRLLQFPSVRCCLLFGGQISRSCDLMATTLQNSLAFLPSLRRIDVISDFDNATFNGLKSMF